MKKSRKVKKIFLWLGVFFSFFPIAIAAKKCNSGKLKNFDLNVDL